MKYLYQINEKYKFIYFIVPKCATRTMFKIFDFQPVRFRELPNNYCDYYSWTFVRNPYDRLCSSYTDKIVNKTKGGLYPYRSCKDFSEFIDAIRHQDFTNCDRHIRMQTSLFPRDINFVGKLENYDKDSKYIFTKYNKTEHVHININSTTHTHYQNLYNERTRNIVSKLYHDDLNILNYTYEA